MIDWLFWLSYTLLIISLTLKLRADIKKQWHDYTCGPEVEALIKRSEKLLNDSRAKIYREERL